MTRDSFQTLSSDSETHRAREEDPLKPIRHDLNRVADMHWGQVIVYYNITAQGVWQQAQVERTNK